MGGGLNAAMPSLTCRRDPDRADWHVHYCGTCGRHDQPRHHDDREIEERLDKLLAHD
jgi:hypothetical protein